MSFLTAAICCSESIGGENSTSNVTLKYIFKLQESNHRFYYTPVVWSLEQIQHHGALNRFSKQEYFLFTPSQTNSPRKSISRAREETHQDGKKFKSGLTNVTFVIEI